MTVVAGLDPSLTNTGITVLTNGQPTLLTTVGHGGRDGANYNHRSDRIVSQCRTVITETLQHHPALVVIEGPAYGANLPSNHDRAGL